MSDPEDPSFHTQTQETSYFGAAIAAVRGDFLPSIAVFLVALPLCMGIAIASGAPVAAGLITGIIGGLLVGILAGSPLQVSGPAAGLTVIVYGIIQQFGIGVLGAVVLMAGLIQIFAGMFRLGQWFRAVSPAVIHGMLAGIGILIFASQFHVMIDDAPKASGLQNVLTVPQAIAKGLPLPSPSSREERDERSRLLVTLGVLQERQLANLDESQRIARAIAANSQSIDGERSRLIDSQEAIVATLGKIRADLGAQSVSTDISPATKKSVQDAVDASESALAALHSAPPGEWDAPLQSASQSIETLALSLRDPQWAGKIGILTLVVLVAWQAFRPRRLRSIPAPLVAVSVATIASAYWILPIVRVEVPDSLWSAVQFPDLAMLSSVPLSALLQAAVVIALVASAETLLCATAVDQMHSGSRTKYDRELMAQGVGNSVCGLLGALPMTGVIVRSAANVQAGGRTRASAILHGVWLLVFVVFLGMMLRYIPISCLAAVLVYTGYKLVDIDGIKELRKYGWGEVFIYSATVIGIVVTDLLVGVLIGVALSAIKLLLTFSHLQVSMAAEPRSRTVTLTLEGSATFLRLPLLASKLAKVAPDAELHIDFDRLEYIDHACLDLLINWAKQHEATGGSLVVDWDSLHAHFRRDQTVSHRSVA